MTSLFECGENDEQDALVRFKSLNGEELRKIAGQRMFNCFNNKKSDLKTFQIAGNAVKLRLIA